MKFNKGIALSGGAVRGFAHAGVLKAFEEANITFDVFSGASAGSIFAALYCDGYTADEVFDIFKKEKIYNLINLKLRKTGLLYTGGLEKILLKHLRAKTFEELKIPLYIVATDLLSGEIIKFNSGELIPAVLGSSAIPFLLNPIKYQNYLLSDGGLLENLPVSPLQDICKHITGVNANPMEVKESLNGYFELFDRIISLALKANVKNSITYCDLYIEPKGLEKYNFIDIANGTSLRDTAYEFTKKMLSEMPVDSPIFSTDLVAT